MKTDTITGVAFRKTLSNDFGTSYVYKVTLAGGDTGEIVTRTESPAWLAAGQPLTYTVEETAYGTRIKRVQQAGGPSSRGGTRTYDRQAEEARLVSMCLSYAKDVCLGVSEGLTPDELTTDILAMADRFLSWGRSRLPGAANETTSRHADMAELRHQLMGRDQERFAEWLQGTYHVNDPERLTDKQLAEVVARLKAKRPARAA
jgi:hypothetical protein